MPVYDNLTAPIAASPPSGADPSYEPNFEKLSQEIEKSSRSGEVPNWKFVQTEAATVLRDQAKDVRAACWLVIASAYVDGWPGLIGSLAAFKEIHATFWDTMHPPLKRAKARAAVVEWLWQALALALPTMAVTDKHRAEVTGLEQAVFDVSTVLSEKLGNLAPPIGSLRAVIRQRVGELPPEAPPPEPEAPPETAAADGPPSVRAPATPSAPRRARSAEPEISAPPSAREAGSLDAAEEQLSKWREPLVLLAFRARELDPTAAWPYRLTRMALWLTIDAPPELAGGAKTYVPAPRPDMISLLARQFDAGQWAALRENAEDAFTQHRYWVDAQRYLVIAMERLGPSYTAAKSAVLREVGTFFGRLPSLTTLQFANGTPFASPEASGWLSNVTAQGSSGGGGGDGAGPADEALAAAREKVAAGAIDEGIGESLQAARKVNAGRDRFRITLGAAQLAHSSGKQRFAIALYEQLLPEVTPALEVWDPKLCAEYLLSYLKVLREGPDQNPGDERQALLFRRLLSLDPAIAVRLSV